MNPDDLFRVYLDPAEIDRDGYPHAWHGYNSIYRGDANRIVSIKDHVRALAGHRCVRCGHPYTAGDPRNSARSEWTRCDHRCTHGEPIAVNGGVGSDPTFGGKCNAGEIAASGLAVEAQWRILTVHHLNGIKHDCRWWNLAALCQRCHLSVQTRVIMQRPYNRPHSEWFKPYVAGYYASLRGEEITREEAMERMDEILSTHAVQLMLGLEVEERL